MKNKIRGTKIERIVIDELSEIPDYIYKKVIRKPNIWDKFVNFFRKLFRVRNKNYWMGVDISKEESTICYGHIAKKGIFMVDKIKRIEK